MIKKFMFMPTAMLDLVGKPKEERTSESAAVEYGINSDRLRGKNTFDGL